MEEYLIKNKLRAVARVVVRDLEKAPVFFEMVGDRIDPRLAPHLEVLRSGVEGLTSREQISELARSLKASQPFVAGALFHALSRT